MNICVVPRERLDFAVEQVGMNSHDSWNYYASRMGVLFAEIPGHAGTSPIGSVKDDNA